MINKLYLSSQVNRYALLFVGRVGSSYLTSLMNSHPNIQAHMDDITEIKDQGPEAQLRMVRQFLSPPPIGQNKVIGFKTKPANMLDPESFAELLRENHCRIIQLQRRNQVKSVVSHLNGKRLAEKTGMWGLFDESNRPTAFEIDPEEFDSTLKNRQKVEQKLVDYVQSLNLPTLAIYYEEMLVDLDDVMKRIFSFLEVAPHKVKANELKITSDDLREVLTNFDELRAMYVGTPYEAMFDEVLTR